MWHLRAKRAIDNYFTGGISPAAEADMRLHLARCATCRERYERHLVAETALPDGERRAEDRGWQGILAAARAADARGPADGAEPAAVRPGRRFFVPVLALAGAAAVALVSLTQLRRSSDPVERGGPAASPSGRPVLHVYRSLPGGGSEPVSDGVRAGDGLLLAYSNPGAQARWLMVFAVDASCRVFWFYPAHERDGEDPGAIAIRANENGVELGEEIRHALTPGPLALHALFLAEPMRVHEAEALVSGSCKAPPSSLCAPMPLRAGQQDCRLLQVGP
jgi:hypothetical protein